MALETGIIWVLWKAYREKDAQIQSLIERIIASDSKHAAILERVERLLDSQRHSDAR